MTSLPLQLMLIAALLAIAAGAYYEFAPRRAPEVEFMTLHGKTLKTSDLLGKVVLVNFWSTDCIPCVHEMPELARVQRQFEARGFDTIAVAMSYDPPNYVARYSADADLPFEVALDPIGEIARQFGDVRYTPTTVILDRRGYIIGRYEGELHFAKLRKLLEQALQQGAQPRVE